ncbi:MAG: hypothetical protein SXG53_14430, partial [Pseudomonadota bacterium]|nr:hypothetical protein [Pseudomonadota bacterium]
MSQLLTDDASVQSAGAQHLVVESEPGGGVSNGCAPVLEPTLLAHIQQLNHDYLELLVAERDTPHGAAQLQHLPPRQRTALAALSPRSMRAVAAMPYTLYSLGFEEEHFWDAVCTSATAST